jgi:hypothetical protein
MVGPGLAEAHTAASEHTAPAADRWPSPWPKTTTLALAGVTILGIVLRVIVVRQSLFADELSTYWISATHGLGTVVSLLYGTASIHHAEITPPLYFVAAWLTTQLGHTPELLRAPSLLAGSLTIPAVYLLGERTVGRRAALPAAALTACSPFMIYYSTEARAYAVMMLLVVLSTLTMLRAVETHRARWWVVYAVCSCLAVYTHLTSVFVLGAQLLWLLWAHPHARRPAIAANLGVLAGLLPWTVGFVNDLTSPTLQILSALSPFSAHQIPIILGHWAIGYPYANYDAGLARLPGTIALVLLALATMIALTGLVFGRLRDRGGAPPRSPDPRLVLILALALATPVGEAVVSTFSSHIFGVRNLAASWPALALAFAALLTATGPRLRIATVGLALASFAIGGARMLSAPYSRPDYQSAAAFIDRAPAVDVVIDETGEISPGPLTPMDVALRRPLRAFRAGSPAERTHPFGFLDPIASLGDAVSGAVAAAHGGTIALVSSLAPPGAQVAQRREPLNPSFPASYQLVATRVYPGVAGTEVRLYSEHPR